MAKFKYVVKDKEGKTLKGALEAASKVIAIQSLRSRELTIVTLEQEKRLALSLDMARIFKKKSIKIDELVIFSRQLATMVSRGYCCLHCKTPWGLTFRNHLYLRCLLYCP